MKLDLATQNSRSAITVAGQRGELHPNFRDTVASIENERENSIQESSRFDKKTTVAYSLCTLVCAVWSSPRLLGRHGWAHYITYQHFKKPHTSKKPHEYVRLFDSQN